MPRLTVQDLKRIRESARKTTAFRRGDAAEMSKYRTELLLCGGTGCHSSGSAEVTVAMQEELVRRHGERVGSLLDGQNGFSIQYAQFSWLTGNRFKRSR